MAQEKLSYRTLPRAVPVQKAEDIQSVFHAARNLVGASRNAKLLRESVYLPHPENNQLRIGRGNNLEIHGPCKATLEQMAIALHSLLATILAKQKSDRSNRDMWDLDRHILEQLLQLTNAVPLAAPAPRKEHADLPRVAVEAVQINPLQRRLAEQALRMRSFWENVAVTVPGDRLRWRLDGLAGVQWD